MSDSRNKLPLLALAAVAALAVAGCGLGSGGKHLPGGVHLVITRDFGHKQLYSARLPSFPKDETVLGLLQAKHMVARSDKTVRQIAGLKEKGGDDWDFFVNGLAPALSADHQKLSKGDVVQWDYAPRHATSDVAAIVGAYPEPFVRGIGGKRFPVRVECSQPSGSACKTVTGRLGAAGAVTSSSSIGQAAGSKTLRIVVAPWTKLQGLGGAIGSLTEGPRQSGVFARFSADGNALSLLDERGRAVRIAPAGTGLIAATQQKGGGPVWVVTGLDDAGVDRAAKAFGTRSLRNAYAVAVTPGRTARLPLRSP
jgi:hypothetical protein